MFVNTVYAQCPVCVVTVGGGLIIAKKLGVDNLLVSLWISGLNTAFAFWFATSFKKKYLRSGILWSFFLFLTTLIYLIVSKQTGMKGNTFLGMDKTLFGIVFGYIQSLAAIGLDRFLRSKNKGKVFFSYQKVIVPFVLLLITTGLFSRLIIIFRR